MSTAALQRTLTDLARLPRAGMLEATKATERIARDVGNQAGPAHLGKRRRTVRLRAISRIKGSYNAPQAVVYGVPTGPWVWVTSGTGSHTIPKQRRNRKVRYLKGDRYPHPYGLPVTHPGGSGRGAWKRVVQRANRDVRKAFVGEVRKALR